MILAALAMEAGLPDGVLNIVHGTHVWYTTQELAPVSYNLASYFILFFYISTKWENGITLARNC